MQNTDTDWYRVYMIHKKRDSVIPFLIHRQPLLLAPFHQLMVKLNEQERLVLYVSEKVVFADEVKHVWSAET